MSDKKHSWLSTNDSDDDDSDNSIEDFSDDDRHASRAGATGRASKRRRIEEADVPSDASVNELNDDEEDENADENTDENEEDDEDGFEKLVESAKINFDIAKEKKSKSTKLKPLTKDQLEASRAAVKKTGVVYLSRVPPYMKPQKVRHLLERFGKLGRVFLSPEDPKNHAKRKKYGGNRRKNYEEGWVEFMNRKEAKLAAETLNTQIIGGKKGGYYYEDIWNIKYLPKFKWHHLTEQIANENASRQARLRAEIAQSTRENKMFIRNVEKAKMIENMQAAKKKKKMDTEGEPATMEKTIQKVDVRRQFRQNSAITSSKKGNEEEEKKAALQKLLGQIF